MLLRDALGETLRDARTRQNRTLRDVSTAANVSLGYLSEVERGRKEASSELLASICDALALDLSDVLDTVSKSMRVEATVADKRRVTSNSAKATLADRGRAAKSQQEKRILGSALRIVVPYNPRSSASVG